MKPVYQIMDSFFGEFEEYLEIPKGKGVRGQLVLTINPEAEKLAAIVESIHLASLLHDDVIDNAELRRGVTSVNAKYGPHTAIMLGDIVYSRAFMELVEFPKPVAYEIAKAVYLLSQGELEDVKLSRQFTPDRNRYFQMIYKKTASLIEGACKGAALLRGWDGERFGLYGKNLGLAFQIVDDLLDIVGEEEVLGKPAMGDFREGKTTLPYIYLYERIDEGERTHLLSLYKRELTPEEREWIRQKMEEYGIIEKVKREAVELVEEAKRAVADYGIVELEKIADKVVNRRR